MNVEPNTQFLNSKGYDLLGVLGEGSFSVVNLCIRQEDRTFFALKTFPKHNLKTTEDEKRFQREIDVMTYLRSDNIVILHDMFSDNDNFYLVCDYCSGGTLFDYIIENERINEPLAALFFKQIITAVALCHSHSVAHRDIKPENILITEFPNLKVSDFGLCGYIDEKRLMSTFCGSPCYCSPECLCRMSYDGELSDIWSLGVILYTMVTGEHPWDVNHTSQMIKQVLEAKYELPDYLSIECKDLISRMLQIQPSNRIPIKDIIDHPFLKYSQKAMIDKKKLNDIHLSFSRINIDKTTPLELISSSSSISASSDHGIISPFFDEEAFSDSEVGPISITRLSLPSVPKLFSSDSRFSSISTPKNLTKIVKSSSFKKKIFIPSCKPINTMSVIKEIE